MPSPKGLLTPLRLDSIRGCGLAPLGMGPRLRIGWTWVGVLAWLPAGPRGNSCPPALSLSFPTCKVGMIKAHLLGQLEGRAGKTLSMVTRDECLNVGTNSCPVLVGQGVSFPSLWVHPPPLPPPPQAACLNLQGMVGPKVGASTPAPI